VLLRLKKRVETDWWLYLMSDGYVGIDQMYCIGKTVQANKLPVEWKRDEGHSQARDLKRTEPRKKPPQTSDKFRWSASDSKAAQESTQAKSVEVQEKPVKQVEKQQRKQKSHQVAEQSAALREPAPVKTKTADQPPQARPPPAPAEPTPKPVESERVKQRPKQNPRQPNKFIWTAKPADGPSLP
jgi:hypothetical protein